MFSMLILDSESELALVFSSLTFLVTLMGMLELFGMPDDREFWFQMDQ